MLHDLLRELDLEICGRHAVQVVLADRLHHALHYGGIAMSENDRRKRRVIVDVSLAVLVPQIRALRTPDAQRRLGDANGRVQSAGRVELGLLVQAYVQILGGCRLRGCRADLHDVPFSRGAAAEYRNAWTDSQAFEYPANAVSGGQKVGGVLIHKTRAIDFPGLRYAWGIDEGKKNESPGLSSWRVPPTVSSSWPDST